jgi:GNAT superfamily N-acetyltransferase
MASPIDEVVEADVADLAALAGRGVYRDFDPSLLVRERADAHFTVLRSGAPVARASVWWRETPELEGARVGAIGHFAAEDEAAAGAVLDAVLERLRGEGVVTAVGPMDGNTWRRYRFVTESSGEPAFAMEPSNPPEYPVWWETCGFEPLAGYSSALDRTLAARDERMDRVADRMSGTGIVIRHVAPERLDAELSRIYAVARESFTQNFLYTPLSEDDFKAQYMPYAAYVEPGFVLVAEDEAGAVGFVFALPDLAQAARGEIVDTVILKTLAVLPGRRQGGLGSLLVEMVRDNAREKGFRRAIYALMFDANVSRNIADHFGETMRRYTLYRRDLRP